MQLMQGLASLCYVSTYSTTYYADEWICEIMPCSAYPQLSGEQNVADVTDWSGETVCHKTRDRFFFLSQCTGTLVLRQKCRYLEYKGTFDIGRYLWRKQLRYHRGLSLIGISMCQSKLAIYYAMCSFLGIVPGQWRNFCPFVPKSCTVPSRWKP